MVFLLVMALLVLVLSAFYLVNSWQQYGTWLWPTFLVVASLAVSIFAGVSLWTSRDSNKTSSPATSQTTSSSTSFSQPATGGLTGQTSFQSESTTQQNVLKQLKQNYQSIGGVTFDQSTKTYRILPTDDNTVKALNYIIQHPDQADDAGWTSFTKNLTKTSKQLSKVIGDDYSLSIQKPDHDDQAMFTVKDGKTTYDIFKQ